MLRLIVTTRKGETREVGGDSGLPVMDIVRGAGFDKLLAL